MGTISIKHGVKPRIDGQGNGSRDNLFTWKRLSPTFVYERFHTATPLPFVQVVTTPCAAAMIDYNGAADYSHTHLSYDYIGLRNAWYQRPAFYLKRASPLKGSSRSFIVTSVMMQHEMQRIKKSQP